MDVETICFQQAQKRVELCQLEAQGWASQLKDNEAVWMRKMTMAQQWAHEAWKESEPKLRELPEEYQCHPLVFDEDRATHFPPA